MWKPAAETGKVGLQVGLSWFLEDSKVERLVVHSAGDDGFLSSSGCALPDRLGSRSRPTATADKAGKKILDTIKGAVLERKQEKEGGTNDSKSESLSPDDRLSDGIRRCIRTPFGAFCR